MINPIHVRQCRKEAVVGTVKDIGEIIVISVGMLGGILAGVLILVYGGSILVSWLTPYNLESLVSLSGTIICGLGITGFIGIIVLAIHEVYKSNLEKCIERIKLEGK